MTPERAEHYMRRAIELSRAKLETSDGRPFGAVVVLNDAIVGEASNEAMLTNDPTAHAEVLAIRRACRHLGRPTLEGAVLFASAYPCSMCLSAVYWAGIETFYYGCTLDDTAAVGFTDGKIYRELARPASQRQITETPLLHGEAAPVLGEWRAGVGRGVDLTGT